MLVIALLGGIAWAAEPGRENVEPERGRLAERCEAFHGRAARGQGRGLLCVTGSSLGNLTPGAQAWFG